MSSSKSIFLVTAMAFAASTSLLPAMADSTPSPAAQPSNDSDQTHAQPPGPTAAVAPQPTNPSESALPVPAEAPGSKTKDQAQQASSGIEEIVVTARRTKENLQSVPVAISVMSSDDLRREHVDSAQDLQGHVPSLVIGSAGQQRNTETPTIRGQGATYGAAPGVVIYFAEVPLPEDSVGNNQGGAGKFFDLGNVQVLKGSQGTLFGRNTTGGALLLEPHKPDRDFSAYLQTEGSSLAGIGYEGVLNAPLVDDKLLLRAGVKYFRRDGFTHDVVTGTNYDSKNYWTARLGLTWRPTSDIDNYLLAYYSYSHDNGTGSVLGAINSAGFNAAILGVFGVPVLPGVPPQDQAGCLYFDVNSGSTNCGQDLVAAQQARGNRKVILDAHPNDILKTGGITDALTFDLSDSTHLRNIVSFASYKHHFRWDQDGSSAAINDITNADGDNQSDTQTITEELQLQGNALNSRLVYAIGGFYDRVIPSGPQLQTATSLFTPTSEHFFLSSDSYAPYAQGTYDLGGLANALSDLKLTLGYRYTFDSTNGYSDFHGVHSAHVKDAAPTYTAGLDYKLTDASLVYGKYSRGYKTGGFGPIAVNPANYTFRPEYVKNYELGYKTDFTVLTMPVRLNSALYYTDYKDLQRTAGDSYTPPNSLPGTMPAFGGATFNVGSAQIDGLELEGTLQATPRLRLTTSYSYTNAQYKKFNLLIGTVTAQEDCSGQQIPRGSYGDYKCIPFQFVAKNQASFNAQYQLPVDDHYGDVALSATYSWMDRQYTAPTSVPDAEPGAWLAPFGLLNASFDWNQVYRSNFGLSAYVTNATNKQYRVSNTNVYNVLYVQASIYGEPRIIGLQLHYRWE